MSRGHSQTLHLRRCKLISLDGFGRPAAESPQKSRPKRPAAQDPRGDAEAAGTHTDPGSELLFAKALRARWGKKLKRVPEEDGDLRALGSCVLHAFGYAQPCVLLACDSIDDSFTTAIQ